MEDAKEIELKMVQCLIVDCSRRSDRSSEVKPRFFRVPMVVKNQGEEWEKLTQERRDRWIAAISRSDLTENILQNDRVCDKHFVSGSATADWNKLDVDWVPTLHLGKKNFREVNAEANQKRVERQKLRAKRKLEEQEKEAEEKRKRVNEPGQPLQELNLEEENQDCVASTSTVDTNTQTEEIDYLFEGREEKIKPFDRLYFENDDAKVRFYSGLPSFDVLLATFNHVAPHVRRESKTLTPFQEFAMVLIKLRLNVPLQDLAYRFGIRSVSTVSRTFTSWIKVMDARLRPLIAWPDREALW